MSMSLKAAKAGGSAYRRTANMGDPGLFGGIVGAIRGGVGSLLSGGNPLAGAVRGAVTGFKGPQQQQRTLPVQIGPTIGLPGGFNLGPPISKNVPAVPAGGGTRIAGVRKGRAVAVPGQLYEEQTRVRGGCPSGYHPNRSSYYRQSPDGGVIHIPKGTVCVKNRRRNPMNPRALRRAISRVEAGKRWQSKLSEITTGKYTAAGNRKS